MMRALHPQPTTAPILVREALTGVISSDDRSLVDAELLREMARIAPGESRASTTRTRNGYGVRRLSLDEVAGTLTQNSLTQNSAWQTYHPSENRPLSVADGKRIASFPDAFTLAEPKTNAWLRIGNSVPPLFARAIALHLRGVLGR
jgi:DNA (cytosine-5)-methyltransferase 1